MYSLDTTKYLIHIHIEAEGVVEKPDVVGAVFGQTEGLLGEEMDLRDLQRSGRIGRIDVQITSRHGKTTGELYIASSLDRAETAILAASLETIERVGPCVSLVKVQGIEDLRAIKRRQIVDRAKELLLESFDDVGISTNDILAEVREAIRIEKISAIGEEHLPAGPNVLDSDAVIIVEGRADVLNLLKCGIKNTVAVEGTRVPASVIDLAVKKNTTVFVDGDRGGDLILRELLDVAEIDFVAFSPRGRSVEDMTRKEIVKSLRNKVPADVLRTRILQNEPIPDLVFEITDEPGEEAVPPEPQPAEEEPAPKKTLRRKPAAEKKPDIPPETVEPVPDAVEPLPEEEPPVPVSSPVRVPDPKTVQEHAEWMKQSGRARLLTAESQIYGDYSIPEIYDLLPQLKADVAGVIIDAPVNQKFIDQATGKGLKFVVAKKFENVVRRPVPLRMILLQ
jgi:DNA primase